jgi:menaquinone-specific isochorismate synthase
VTSAPVLALLTATTVRIEDPGALLDLLPEDGALAWVTRGEGLVGWGESARFEVAPSQLAGADRFELAEQWWRGLTDACDVSDDVRLPGTGLVAFGSFAFDGERGSSVLVVPEVVVGCRGGTWWTTRIRSGPADPAPRSGTPVRAPGAVRYADGSRSSAGWTSVVADAVERIAAGELAKVVLARDLEARTERPLDVRWPLRRLAADYPECRTFAVDGLFGATPEVYVQLERGVATSRVLAGTIRRSGDAVRDVERASSLARSSKDLEEHEYAVRSVAEALATHCDAVDVPDEPFVLHLANVMHLATDVRATVADGATSLSLVASLHPSAAVCGTPTAAAMGVIRDLEGLDRGRYAGPVGWTGADGDGEWGIALRCAEVAPDDPRRLRLFAGCGIVAGSRPEQELAESAAKLVPVRDALQA